MKSENPTKRTVEKIEAAKQLRVGMKTTAPCKNITPLFDNMTDFNGWAISDPGVLSSVSGQISSTVC